MRARRVAPGRAIQPIVARPARLAPRPRAIHHRWRPQTSRIRCWQEASTLFRGPFGVTMRRCEAADYPRILEIINAAAEAYRGVIPDDCWHEPYMPAAQLEREIAAGVQFWGCDAIATPTTSFGLNAAKHLHQGRELVGVMGIQAVKDVALVRHAYVWPGLQRAGIGTMLMKHL